MLPALIAFGPSGQDQARILLKETLHLYNDHQKEAGETLVKAYKGGTYTKVSRLNDISDLTLLTKLIRTTGISIFSPCIYNFVPPFILFHLLSFIMFFPAGRKSQKPLPPYLWWICTSQVLEFVAFKERLDAAHIRAVARTERHFMDIREAAQQVQGQKNGGRVSATPTGGVIQKDVDLVELINLHHPLRFQ